jgi:Ser/Thr protein kinase RdoA (MazF antagonist)
MRVTLGFGDLIVEEFGLGRLQSCEALGPKGRLTMLLTTDESAFVIKSADKREWLSLYSTVEQQLNAAGIRQARLHVRPDGSLLSTSGYAVYEHLPGEPIDHPTHAQLLSALRYLARYNQALARIPVPEWAFVLDDPWKRAADPDYLIDELASQLDSLRLSPPALATAGDCLNFLAGQRQVLRRSEKRLIHGDLGPGNLLFEEDEVVAVIDFTPQPGSELYSLCQFFYWHFLFLSDSGLRLDRIGLFLNGYRDAGQSLEVDEEALKVMMVLAAAFRLFGPSMAAAEGLASYSAEAITRRAELLAEVLSASFGTATPSRQVVPPP